VDVLRIKEESSFVLICGCYIFFISVGEPVKRKAFCLRKVDIPAAGDASKETHCTSATLGIVPSTVNTTVYNQERCQKLLCTMWQVLWSEEGLEITTISRPEESVDHMV
jgi:hypothetical protein